MSFLFRTPKSKQPLTDTGASGDSRPPLHMLPSVLTHAPLGDSPIYFHSTHPKELRHLRIDLNIERMSGFSAEL